MRFQLLISCNNAAFGDDAYGRSHEVRRMLRQVERDMFESIDERHEVDPGQEHRLRDANGNTAGTWAFVDE